MTSAESEPEAPAQTSFDAATVQALLERLGGGPDDSCVISLAAASHEAGAAGQLAFASVLFGPPEMAAEPWPRWSARTNPGTARLVAQWEAAGLALSQYREFSEVREGFLFGRWTVTAGQSATMARWLAELLNGQVTTVPGTGSPPLMASPRESTALIRAFPFLASPAGQLIRAAGRPVTGFLFPLDVIPGLPAPQSTWDLEGYRLYSAPLWLLGLQTGNSPAHGSAVSDRIQSAPALFVGRLQRQAWITGLRVQHDPGLFAIGLGIDESRISLADLEIDLEEYADGDLASARRIRLGDLALPPGPAVAGKDVTVVLPTLGPGLRRQVRLFDRNGLLLDATDRLAMVEKIDIEGTAAGGQPFRVTIGQRNAVGLLDRLKRAGQSDAAYCALLEAGLPGRVVDDPQHGLPALTALLSQAHGQLDVLDAYFGWDVSDWSVLAQVSAPIRVLTGHGYYDGRVLRKRKVIQPPPGTAPQAPSLEVRSWRGHPAWHDRVYLWAGGGLTVGTSPSGLGKRIARIDRLGAAEAAGWQSHFAAWWSGQDVAPI